MFIRVTVPQTVVTLLCAVYDEEPEDYEDEHDANGDSLGASFPCPIVEFENAHVRWVLSSGGICWSHWGYSR
jgi:hypothetical protein